MKSNTYDNRKGRIEKKLWGNTRSHQLSSDLGAGQIRVL